MPEQIKEASGMMTTGEVAKYLRISRASVYRLVKQGKIPVSRVGKHLRFRKGSIDRWLSEHEAMSFNASKE